MDKTDEEEQCGGREARGDKVEERRDGQRSKGILVEALEKQKGR